jgi:hypothetical protein
MGMFDLDDRLSPAEVALRDRPGMHKQITALHYAIGRYQKAAFKFKKLYWEQDMAHPSKKLESIMEALMEAEAAADKIDSW